MKTNYLSIIVFIFLSVLPFKDLSAQTLLGNTTYDTQIHGRAWVDIVPNQFYGGIYLCNNNYQFRFVVRDDYTYAYNHFLVRNKKDIVMKGGDIWLKSNYYGGGGAGNLIIESQGNLELRDANIRHSGIMSFESDYDNSGDNGYNFLDSAKQVFVNFNGADKTTSFTDYSNETFIEFDGMSKTASFDNVSIKGTLSLDSSRFESSSAMVFQIGNTTNSHFSIENPVGTKLLYANLQGNVGIGTSSPSEKFEVEGKVKANSFIADASSFPDYVFTDEYKLKPLNEVKAFIKNNHHLPGVPSEQEVVENGLDIKDITIKAIEKIEELHLYIFELEERLRALENNK